MRYLTRGGWKTYFRLNVILSYAIMAILTLYVFMSCSSRTGVAAGLKELFPIDGEIDSWQQIGKANVFKGDRLYEYIDGGAEIFYEYGFNQVITRDYRKGEEILRVDIYEMNDSTSAYGIYSVQKDPVKPSLDAGDEGTQYDFHAAFWQDRFYVVVSGDRSDDTTKMVIREFARSISSRIGKHYLPPDVVNLLPGKYLLSGTSGTLRGLLGLNTRLYLGASNVLDLDGEAVKGAFADYALRSENAHLVLVRYPDASQAADKAIVIEEIFKDQYESRQENDGRVIFVDGNGLLHAVMVKDNILFLFTKATSLDWLIENIETEI